MRRSPLAVALAVCSLWISAAGAVDRFDLVYIDHAEETFAPDQVGTTLSAFGFALLVNSGTVPITADEILNIRFTATSSDPMMSLIPDVSNLPLHAPIAPGVAMGSVEAPVDVLLAQLDPDEVLVNTAPSSVLIFSLDERDVRPPRYAGSVHFDVTFICGGQEVRFPMQIDVVRGAQSGARYFSAARVRSVAEGTVTAQATTWGRLKSLYR